MRRIGKVIEAIRAYYDDQLMALGFRKPARRTVNFPEDNPYYDILLASRHPRGLDLWNKTNPVPVDPQLSLLDDGDADEPLRRSSRNPVARFRGIAHYDGDVARILTRRLHWFARDRRSGTCLHDSVILRLDRVRQVRHR